MYSTENFATIWSLYNRIAFNRLTYLSIYISIGNKKDQQTKFVLKNKRASQNSTVAFSDDLSWLGNNILYNNLFKDCHSRPDTPKLRHTNHFSHFLGTHRVCVSVIVRFCKSAKFVSNKLRIVWQKSFRFCKINHATHNAPT